MSWKQTTLGDVIRLRRGHDLPSHCRVDGDIPIISSSGITGYHNVSKVSGPGVVTGRYGTLGEVHYIEGPYWPLNTSLYVEDFKGNNPRFVAYLLSTLGLAERNTAGAVPGVNRNSLHPLPVSIPSVAEQAVIANCLARYDELIANNCRRIALLEESARLIYHEWFVNLRFPNARFCPQKSDIPLGWSQKSLSEVIELNPKISYEKNVLYPFVPMQALSETSMVIRTVEERIISGGAKFQNKDTLFARITPCLENGKTGFVQFLEEEKSVASGSTEFIVLRSKTVSPYWVYCLARDEKFREYAISSMVGSDGRQRVNIKCFDAYKVLQPSHNVLEAFNALVGPIFDKIQVLENINQRLYEALDALLPKLMSGEIQL